MSIITIRWDGRFGNHLFQYAVARAHAEKYGAELILPPWEGPTIFNLDDKIGKVSLPNTEFNRLRPGQVDVCVCGHYQNQEYMNLLSQTKLKSWLQFRDRWREKFSDLFAAGVEIAAHLRRGDYATYVQNFCLISPLSYEVACRCFGLDPAKITWVSEETQRSDPELEALNIPFLADFILLCTAKHLFRANSTFSWWAGTLGSGQVYSPVVAGRYGPHDVSFVRGNSPRMAGVEDLNLPP